MAEKTTGIFNTRERREARMQDFSGAALSDQAYNAVMGITVTAGLALTALLANVTAPFFATFNPWIMLIGYLVITIGACVAINKATTPVVGLLGFGVLSAATGCLLSWVVIAYDLAVIQQAVLITGGVTGVMFIAATFFPAFFQKLGPVLFAALIIDLLAGVICTFIFRMYLPIFAWIGIVIFSLYIGYDFARAQEYPKTVNNAINAAADIYLDIINLFLRIVEILGNDR